MTIDGGKRECGASRWQRRPASALIAGWLIDFKIVIDLIGVLRRETEFFRKVDQAVKALGGRLTVEWRDDD